VNVLGALVGRRGVRGTAESFWLARREIRETWPSYSLSGLFVVLVGFFAVVSLSGVIELEGFGSEGRRMEGFYNAFFSDYLFLVVCAYLGINVISGNFTLAWCDAASSRLLFSRSLPVGAEILVGSRALCMLFALAVGAAAFFLPAFSLVGLGVFGGASYLWFCGVWVGYGLFASGLWLHFELVTGARVVSSGIVVSLMAVVAFLEWTLDLSLVERTAHVAREGYGAFAAVFAILAGGAFFALLCRTTTRRLEKRELY